MPHDESFCIIGSIGRFHPRYGAYLPAIEPSPCEGDGEDLGIFVWGRDHEGNSTVGPFFWPHSEDSWKEDKPKSYYRPGSHYEIEQLKGEISYLEGKINEHIEASRKRRKGSW